MKSKKQWFRRALSLVLSLGLAMGLFCTNVAAATRTLKVKVDYAGTMDPSGSSSYHSAKVTVDSLGRLTLSSDPNTYVKIQSGYTLDYYEMWDSTTTRAHKTVKPGETFQGNANSYMIIHLKSDGTNKLPAGWHTSSPGGSVVRVWGALNGDSTSDAAAAFSFGPTYRGSWYYQASPSYSTNNQRFAIPSVDTLFKLNSGWKCYYVATAGNGSGGFSVTGNSYSPGSLLMAANGGSLVYYFTRSSSTIYPAALLFDFNGGSYRDETTFATQVKTKYTSGGSVTFTVPGAKPTRGTDKFLGWSTNPKATAPETKYGDGSKATNFSTTAETTILYAVWAKQCTIIYEDGQAGGKAFDPQKSTAYVGDTTPGFEGGQDGKPADYIDGDGVTWTFTGWSPEVKPTVDGDQTYVAQWRALKDPTIDDIGIDKSAEKDAYVVDDTVKYTIQVTNAGEKDAVVTVTDRLPAALAYEKSEPEGKADGQTITWSGLTVPAAKDGKPGERILTVYAKVKTPGDAIKNEAIVALGNDSKKDDADIKASQNETTSSSKPDDTTKPDGPDDTTKPDGPDDTTKPAGPDDTTKPAGPDDTTKPDGPDDTTKPDGPDDTTKPDGPDDTTKPDGPTEPTNPNGSTEPTNPGGPTEPTNPNGSTEPTNPGGPTQPANPGGPTQPANPNGPTQPSNPEDEDLEDPDIPLGSRPGPEDGSDSNQALLPSKPEEDEEIEDPDVPLSDAPKTGENGTKLPLAAAVVGAAGVTVSALALKKKRDEDTAS